MLTLIPRGPGALPPVRIDGQGATIGRSAGLELTLPDPASIVSSKHCRIAFADGRYVLTDTSTNGTAVNGRRLAAPHPLADGDVLAIGPWQIQVSLDGGAPRAATPAIDPDWHRKPAQPAGATMQQPAANDAVGQLLMAAGIPRAAVTAGDAVVLAAAGSLLRQLGGGLMALLADRAKARSELGVAPGLASNNPLKRQPTPELALAQLLGAPQPAERAVAEALAEIDAHQRATLKAMQGALRATLDAVSPDALRAANGKAGAAGLWQSYEKAFAGQGDDSFIEVFARELATAYAKLAKAG